jgi:hypothetical protein
MHIGRGNPWSRSSLILLNANVPLTVSKVNLFVWNFLYDYEQKSLLLILKTQEIAVLPDHVFKTRVALPLHMNYP